MISERGCGLESCEKCANKIDIHVPADIEETFNATATFITKMPYFGPKIYSMKPSFREKIPEAEDIGCSDRIKCINPVKDALYQYFRLPLGQSIDF